MHIYYKRKHIYTKQIYACTQKHMHMYTKYIHIYTKFIEHLFSKCAMYRKAENFVYEVKEKERGGSLIVNEMHI